MTPFESGSYVMHPTQGPCVVQGVESVNVGGVTHDMLVIAPVALRSAAIRIPLAKLPGAELRALDAAEARAEADAWTPPDPSLMAVKMARVRGAKKGGKARHKRVLTW